MKKTFILDTNVLLHDPTCMSAFEENEVVIPLVVLEELDTFKDSENELGRNARTVIRTLDEYRKLGLLCNGIQLQNGGTLRIELNCHDFIPIELDQTLPDNRIIGVAIGIGSRNKTEEIILVSKDINMRVKCDALGVKSQDYKKDHVVSNIDELYSGYTEVTVEDRIVDDFFSGKDVYLKDTNLYPNQFVLLRSEISEKKTALTRFVGLNDSLEPLNKLHDIWDLEAKNKEQKFAFNLLLDPTVTLVTLIGIAGSGKTLLSLAAGLQQIIEKKIYSKLIVSRPIQPMGKDIGFLPGTIEEKMNPWLAPLNDNLEFLFDGRKENLELMKESGLIQVEALTYIRGRSIPRCFIIIDEAQNLTSHELKTIITRVGEGSKIVLTGDISQIDSPYLDSTSNGLSIAIEKFKNYNLSGHITLRSGVRSELATLAAKIL